jgi:hypothetical protein
VKGFLEEQDTSSNASSLGVSYGVMTGGVTLSASKARGNADGSDTSFNNTQVNAGNRATLQSGGDTSLKGAVVSANQIKADVGGSLSTCQEASECLGLTDRTKSLCYLNQLSTWSRPELSGLLVNNYRHRWSSRPEYAAVPATWRVGSLL